MSLNVHAVILLSHICSFCFFHIFLIWLCLLAIRDCDKTIIYLTMMLIVGKWTEVPTISVQGVLQASLESGEICARQVHICIKCQTGRYAVGVRMAPGAWLSDDETVSLPTVSPPRSPCLSSLLWFLICHRCMR